MPGAAPIWYSGSPIQVDFGEERDTKQVLVVDIPERGAAKVRPVALTRGAVLRTLRGTFAELEAAAPGVGDAFLRVFVKEQPRAGLADDVRLLLPTAVDVRVAPDVVAEAPGAAKKVARATTPRDLFGQYLAETGHSADARLVALFDELLDAETV
jgi:exonuclease SbcD